MRNLFFSCMCLVVMMLACSCSKPESEEKTDTEKTTIESTSQVSPIGTYSAIENGKPMQFVLEEGGKGHENYKGEIRPFTWKTKESKIFFTYDGETTEFELPIDIAKGEITYGTLVYKKE